MKLQQLQELKDLLRGTLRRRERTSERTSCRTTWSAHLIVGRAKRNASSQRVQLVDVYRALHPPVRHRIHSLLQGGRELIRARWQSADVVARSQLWQGSQDAASCGFDCLQLLQLLAWCELHVTGQAQGCEYCESALTRRAKGEAAKKPHDDLYLPVLWILPHNHIPNALREKVRASCEVLHGAPTKNTAM